MKEHSVWITGAGGLIGNTLIQSAPKDTPVVPLARQDLDLFDFASIERTFAALRPTAVIHCAAISKNPACNAAPNQAWQINHDATKLLASLASDIPFFFFSTDLVFDGTKGNYNESDSVNPLSVYAETKVAAEAEVLKNPAHTVLRISLNGGRSPSGNRGFNEEMKQAWQNDQELTLFTDEFRCPMSAVHTARATWQLVQRKQTGLLHLCGAEKLSRWEIGQLLANAYPELNPRIRAGSLRGYDGPPRAPDTSLDCSRAAALLGEEFPKFSETLSAF